MSRIYSFLKETGPSSSKFSLHRRRNFEGCSLDQKLRVLSFFISWKWLEANQLFGEGYAREILSGGTNASSQRFMGSYCIYSKPFEGYGYNHGNCPRQCSRGRVVLSLLQLVLILDQSITLIQLFPYIWPWRVCYSYPGITSPGNDFVSINKMQS